MNTTNNKIKNYLKSIPYYAWVLLLIIVVGIFFRTYNFHDWLFLQGDQVRDTMMVSGAFDNGAGDLPLLGPKAGGTLLRLGPVFYYFQYISALIFQNDQPQTMAYPTLLFSMLSIPLFYYMVRKYFFAAWAIALTALFSFSFMLIDYSRYAWNPNATPFFIILFIVSILEIYSPESKRKYFWTIVAAISFAVATQLHFSAFVTLPIILVLFMIFSRKKTKESINWKQVVIFIAIVLAFYTPVILSDIMNSGYNSKQFIHSVTKKSAREPIVPSALREVYNFGKNFVYLLSSYTGSNKFVLAIAQIFILVTFVANILLLKKEKDTNKRNFLLIILIYFSVFCLVYFPLAMEIKKSRFFLPLAPIPFIYLGFLFAYLSQYAFFGKYFLKISGTIIVVILLGYNLHMDLQWIWAMNTSQNQTLTKNNSFALRNKGDKFWWSWNQFQKIAIYMRDNCEKKDIYFTISKSAKDYAASIRLAATYVAKDKNITFVKSDLTDADGCFYFVSQTSEDVSDDIKNNFILEDPVDLGNVSIVRFNFLKNNDFSDKEISVSADIASEEDESLASAEELTPVEDVISDANPGKSHRYWLDAWNFFFKKK